MIRKLRTALLVLSVLGAAVAAPASGSPQPGVSGSGWGTDPAGTMFPGHSHALELNATVSPRGATGRFRFAHFTPDGELFAWLAGTVDCVEVSGGVARVTAAITDGWISVMPDFEPTEKDRMAFTVVDGVVDRVYFEASFISGRELPPCELADPGAYFTVERGNFTVR